jgi:hypothetical protein
VTEQRQTASGIALPEQEGIPIVCLLMEGVPTGQVNIVIPEGRDRIDYAEELTVRICTRQRELDRRSRHGHDPLDLADPHFGDPYYLTPEGVKRVLAITHARAQRMDPLAATRAAQKPRILRAGNGFRPEHLRP